MGVIKNIWDFRPLFVTPIAFLAPIWFLITDDPEMESVWKCAYVICVMAILWVTEAIPIPVTALLPIVLFPMLQVVTAKVIGSSYLTDTSMLFLGGLIVAVALEESNLHVRISLTVMRIVGGQPIWLMLGLMLTTWFLSMWISNTAATAMMIPIIQAVIKTVNGVHSRAEMGTDNPSYALDEIDNGDFGDRKSSNSTKYVITGNVQSQASVVNVSTMSPEMKRLAKGFSLCVAYGANIGGIATLTGTPPNLVLKQQADKIYEELGGLSESPIIFAKWMGFAFPMSLICVILAWLWLVLVFVRCGCCNMKPTIRRAVNEVILEQYNALGRIRFVEIEVLIVFIILVILWLFRAPPNIDGWGVLFEETGSNVKYVSDSTPVMLLSILLFILPARIEGCIGDQADGVVKSHYSPILNWKVVSEKVPWGVIVLLGGGFAIAKAATISGLSKWLGEQMATFSDLDEWVMNLIICFIVAAFTEIASNTATATILMPILAQLALATNIHPLYLMMSSAVACSFAFMLPVATPPNAIVFSTGYLTVLDMVLVGFPMNIIAIGCLTLSINTWGKAMYDLDSVPGYFLNATSS